ncbi:rod shape-determining protein MreD [Candidatus Cloacimonadota bacterium]
MRNLKLIIWSILALYWQLLMPSKFMFADVIPNFLIPFIIFIHLRFELRYTLPVAFVLGLSLDLLQPAFLGLNTLAFLIISFLVHHYHHPINKKRLLIVITSIFLLNLCYYGIFYIFQLLSGALTGEISQTYIWTLFYNTFLSFISIYLLILIDKTKLSIHE